MEACEFWSALSDDNDAHAVLQSHLGTLIPSLISRLQLKEEQILQVCTYVCMSVYLSLLTSHVGLCSIDESAIEWGRGLYLRCMVVNVVCTVYLQLSSYDAYHLTLYDLI